MEGISLTNEIECNCRGSTKALTLINGTINERREKDSRKYLFQV
jgi:hypothetical protein